LQTKLGKDYEVVEEGLNGRTTTLDDPDPGRIGKNGKAYLVPCLESQNPIDIIVLMLGTNDAKLKFNSTAKRIAHGLEELVAIMETYAKTENGTQSKIVIVSPPHIREAAGEISNKYRGSQVKIEALAEEYANIAERRGHHFVDIAQCAKPSQKDGLHLEPGEHLKIAERLSGEIQKLVNF
jgi:lysophospholipase L1-like esterase